MKKYEILEHRADLKIKVFGRNKKELFFNALLGMGESMKPEFGKLSEKVTRKIETKSIDSAALLVDFLSQVLCLSQINKETYSKIDFSVFSDTALTGELSGQKIERFGEDIKAVTHHGLNIHQKANGIWEATILFDI